MRTGFCTGGGDGVATLLTKGVRAVGAGSSARQEFPHLGGVQVQLVAPLQVTYPTTPGGCIQLQCEPHGC